MSKRIRRSTKPTYPTSDPEAEIAHEVDATHLVADIPQNPVPTNIASLANSLSDIRAQHRDQTETMHANVAHTIAELEHWRAEIEATIAFLKHR